MARLINGANGPFIGKAGSFIGYTMNGVSYMKGIPKLRTKPFTEAELLNQKKFGEAQRWIMPIKDFLKVGFKGYNKHFQGLVAAKSYLMKNAMRVEDGEVIIDPALVKISHGTLPLPPDITCRFEEPNIMRFNWKPSGGDPRFEQQQVMVLAYDIEHGWPSGNLYGNGTSAGEQIVVLPDFPGKSTIYCYLAFLATDRSQQSDSIYLGAFETSN